MVGFVLLSGFVKDAETSEKMVVWEVVGRIYASHYSGLDDASVPYLILQRLAHESRQGFGEV